MTESTVYEQARDAMELLELGNLKWIDRAWSVYYGWPAGVDPALREVFRGALGKLQLCHTGDIVDPSIEQCRAVLEQIVALGPA